MAKIRVQDLAKMTNTIAQTAVGLMHAHAAELIHRDIKPANIAILPNRRVKLLDGVEEDSNPVGAGEERLRGGGPNLRRHRRPRREDDTGNLGRVIACQDRECRSLHRWRLLAGSDRRRAPNTRCQEGRRESHRNAVA